ncbi:gluconokinase [Enterococcus sp. 2201sp1_2201st1_C11_2201SCRN_220225]|uniref:gluconokinase n=2 Tax=unclassified Enterococcus TaxID=2608891 RepID=UPI0034A2FAD9
MILTVFLGIDVGTTAIKFGVIKENELLYTSEFPLKTYGDDRIKYQNRSEILQALKEGILQIPIQLRKAITKMSFSVAMHSLMPMDNSNQVFLWSDLQAAQVIQRFKETPLASKFYEISGTPIHAMSSFAKLLYFHQEKDYAKKMQWYGIKELVMNYFTGHYVIDYATASATGLFDLKKKQWSQEILEYLGINQEQLARLVDTDESFAMLPAMRNLFDFGQSIQVIVGASDGTLAAYASYYATGRAASLTIGTSGAVRKVSNEIQLDSLKQNFCYYLKNNLWVKGAPSNNGGVVLAWSAENLGKNPATFYESLPKLLEKTPLGSKGLRFFPYLNGERAPYWSNEIKGGFHDLTLQHSREDMIRSVVEGMLLNMRQLVELVALGEELSVSGGFFQTAVLGQLAADIFGSTCFYAPQNEPIFGLYYLLEQPELVIEKPQQVFVPQLSSSHEYEKLAQNYFSVNS